MKLKKGLSKGASSVLGGVSALGYFAGDKVSTVADWGAEQVDKLSWTTVYVGTGAIVLVSIIVSAIIW